MVTSASGKRRGSARLGSFFSFFLCVVVVVEVKREGLRCVRVCRCTYSKCGWMRRTRVVGEQLCITINVCVCVCLYACACVY